MIIEHQSFVWHIPKMASSLTVTISNTSPVLQTYFFPEIILDKDYNYSCALLDLIIKSDDSALQNITKLDILRINCDIISGSYINGERVHAIHQFATSASHMKDRIFVEIPKNLNYFPIKTKNIQSIQICIVASDGNLISLQGAEIICRINIKRDSIEKIASIC